jgi:hypothetical protein
VIHEGAPYCAAALRPGAQSTPSDKLLITATARIRAIGRRVNSIDDSQMANIYNFWWRRAVLLSGIKQLPATFLAVTKVLPLFVLEERQ